MKRRVLVVDDNDDARTIIRLRLSKEGFDVTTAAHGAEGLQAICGERPCCVLLDLTMPEMDGFQFLTALRQQPTPPPVFVVTQHDDASTCQRVRQLGAGHVFTKAQAFDRSFGACLSRLLEVVPVVGDDLRRSPQVVP